MKPFRKTSCLAAAICLSLTGTALAAPAANEYLPQPPSATGGKDNPSSGGGGGSTSSGGSDSSATAGAVSTGSGSGGSSGGGTGASPGRDAKRDTSRAKKRGSAAGADDEVARLPGDSSIAPITVTAARDGGDAGVVNTLLEPPVLAFLVLASIALASLLLRRRGTRAGRPPSAGTPEPSRG